MGIFQQFPYSNFHEMNMDEIIKIVRQLADDWVAYQLKWNNLYTDTQQALTDFQNFVNDYFENLDVQDEINNKINDMVTSGEFDQLIITDLSPIITTWMQNNLTQDPATVIDTSLSIAGAAADAKATGDAVRVLENELGEVIKISFEDDLAIDGYQRYDFGDITADSVLNAATGKIAPGTGSGNNFVFEKFIPIPKARLYFACANDYSYNVVFYDANKTVVDNIATDSSMTTLYGKEYNNTRATYMRVGCYKSGGPGTPVNCFAYSYNSANSQDKVFPLYKNTVIYPPNQNESPSKTRMLSDYVWADLPLMAHSSNTNLINFGVHQYDANQNYITTWYVNDIPTGSYISLPSGYYYRFYLAHNSDNINATADVVNAFVIEKRADNIGYLSFSGTNPHLSLVKTRVGTIDIEYAEHDLLLKCDDYGSYLYNVAFYSSRQNNTPIFMTYSGEALFNIPKGSFYRYCVGPSTGNAVPEDIQKIHIIEVNKNTPEIAAINSLAGKTRKEFDSDVMPSYYSSHMQTKASEVNSLYNTNTKQFAFITDYHYGGYNNTNNVRSLLTYLVMNSHLQNIFNGGDVWTSGTSVISYNEAKTRFITGINETTPNAPCDWFFILGNHDNGLDYLVNGGETITFGPYFDTKEMHDILGGNNTGKDIVYDPNSTDFAYYFDEDDTRFIILNNDLASQGADETTYFVLLFLIKALLTMGNKYAVILTHEYFDPYSDTVYNAAARIVDIIEAYNGRTSYNLTSTQPVNFASCTGQIICMIAGHAHMDRDFTLSDGTKVICTTTCNAGAELGSLTRTPGTISENAFDVFSIDTNLRTINITRIGAGANRSFTF